MRRRGTAKVAACAVTCVALVGCAGGSPAADGARTVAPTTARPTSSTSGPTRTPGTPTPPAAVPTTPPAPTGSATLAPVPRAGAEPSTRFPTNRGATGTGASASAAPIPDAVWADMVGFSWTSGCPVGRASLRYLSVNFWGFDGQRSRGAIVVNASIANRTLVAFSRLYEQRFRIRQMKIMDSRWGRNPRGPGANDYAAMDADNTSGFNCRYVGGQESAKVWSNHAYGTAIDVNDFENPYVDAQGHVDPDGWFRTRRSAHGGVFSSASSASVQAFTRQGFRWGGAWSAPDFQHFDLG